MAALLRGTTIRARTPRRLARAPARVTHSPPKRVSSCARIFASPVPSPMPSIRSRAVVLDAAPPADRAPMRAPTSTTLRRARLGLDAVLDRVLDQRDQQQRRERRVAQLARQVELDLQAFAHAQLHELEVARADLELLAERRLMTRRYRRATSATWRAGAERARRWSARRAAGSDATSERTDASVLNRKCGSTCACSTVSLQVRLAFLLAHLLQLGAPPVLRPAPPLGEVRGQREPAAGDEQHQQVAADVEQLADQDVDIRGRQHLGFGVCTMRGHELVVVFARHIVRDRGRERSGEHARPTISARLDRARPAAMPDERPITGPAPTSTMLAAEQARDTSTACPDILDEQAMRSAEGDARQRADASRTTRCGATPTAS